MRGGREEALGRWGVTEMRRGPRAQAGGVRPHLLTATAALAWATVSVGARATVTSTSSAPGGGWRASQKDRRTRTGRRAVEEEEVGGGGIFFFFSVCVSLPAWGREMRERPVLGSTRARTHATQAALHR